MTKQEKLFKEAVIASGLKVGCNVRLKGIEQVFIVKFIEDDGIDILTNEVLIDVDCVYQNKDGDMTSRNFDSRMLEIVK